MWSACANEARDPSVTPATTTAPNTPTTEVAKPLPKAPPPAELLTLHMRDRVGIATQARDAVIRGQLTDAAGSLTWLAQHRQPTAPANARPFVQRLQQHAQRAIDSSDLTSAGEAIGLLAATCGECHAAEKRGPKVEPAGFENLEDALTVTNHMHGYLWATDTLWNALIADAALWETGVTTLATLTPPAKPRNLVPGFAAIQAWAKNAGAATTPAARGQAYGQLIATCGGCHQANGIVPGAQ